MMKTPKMFLGFVCLFLMYFYIQPPMVTLAAEQFPTKPIKFIVPVPPGGGFDTSIRMWASVAEKYLGQEVVIINKPGGGTVVASSFVARSKPDGYTIGGVSSSVFIVAPNFTKMDWDPSTAFTPILEWADMPQVLQVSTKSPIKTFDDLVAQARKQQVTIATVGLTYTAMMLKRLAAEQNLNLKIVPFTGGAPGITAVMGGQIDVAAFNTMFEHVRAGKIRMVARLNGERTGRFKDTPSLKELGYNYETISLAGLVGPKNLPEPIHKKLEDSFTQALKDSSVRETIGKVGFAWKLKNSKEWGEHIQEMYTRVKREMQEAGTGIYAKDKK